MAEFIPQEAPLRPIKNARTKRPRTGALTRDARHATRGTQARSKLSLSLPCHSSRCEILPSAHKQSTRGELEWNNVLHGRVCTTKAGKRREAGGYTDTDIL